MGATKPEEPGYYFRWGDTVGYRPDKETSGTVWWVSSRGERMDGSPFSEGACLTFKMDMSELRGRAISM